MSSPAVELPTFFPTEFDQTWRHLVQQTESRLADTVTIENFSGKEKKINQIGTGSFEQKTERFADTQPRNRDKKARWIRCSEFDDVEWFDEWDDKLLGEIALPTSATMQTFVNAYNRLCDSQILSHALGTNYTGANGTTAVTLPSSQVIDTDDESSGTHTGLDLYKLKKIKEIFGVNEADENPSDPITLVISQAQVTDLLGINEFISNDYNAKALIEGKAVYFLGMNIRKTQLVSKTSGDRSCVAFVKSGLALGKGDLRSMADILPHKSHALQLRAHAWVGGTRLEEEKIIEVKCREA